MTVSEKLKTIITKLSKTKLNVIYIRQTAKTFALSSRNVSKYEFLTGKYVLPEKEKDLLEKAAIMKRFEYSPLGSELKKHNDIAEKQHKILANTYELDKIIKKEKPTVKKSKKSNLIHLSKCSFYE